MSIESARQALDLVGRTVRPLPGAHCSGFAQNRPVDARVVDVCMPDLAHPYIVCQFAGSDEVTYLYPFEVEAIHN